MDLMISLRCWIIPMLFWAVSDQSSCFSNSTLKLMFLNLSKSDQWFRRQGNLVGMSCTRYANPEFEKSETCIWEVTPSLLLRKSEVKKSILTNALKIRSNSRLSALRIWDLWLTNMLRLIVKSKTEILAKQDLEFGRAVLSPFWELRYRTLEWQCLYLPPYATCHWQF